jgi:hypothetical protein
MQMIVPGIESSIRVEGLVAEDVMLSDLLGSVTARAGFGLVLVMPDRRIVYANDTAEALIRRGDGLCCRHNCVGAADSASSRKLQSLITAASSRTDAKMRIGSLMFQDEDGKASLIVHVLPLRANTILGPANQVYPVACLVIVDCHQGMNDRISVFVDLFTLTPAEACVRLSIGLERGTHQSSEPPEYRPIHGAVTPQAHFRKDWDPPPGGARARFLRNNDSMVWTPQHGGSSADRGHTSRHLGSP